MNQLEMQATMGAVLAAKVQALKIICDTDWSSVPIADEAGAKLEALTLELLNQIVNLKVPNG